MYMVIGICGGVVMILSFWIGMLYQSTREKVLDIGTIHWVNSLKEINLFLQTKVNRYENLYTNLCDLVIDHELTKRNLA